jgi:hypothetical protein
MVLVYVRSAVQTSVRNVNSLFGVAKGGAWTVSGVLAVAVIGALVRNCKQPTLLFRGM